MIFLSNWKSSARAVKIAVLVLMSDMAESGLRPVAEMTALDTGVRWLEPNKVGGSTVCVLRVLQSMSLPVFTTGAIVAAYSERQDMISLVPDLLLGWGGITDPYFMKHALRVYLSALPTISRCPPGSYGKLH